MRRTARVIPSTRIDRKLSANDILNTLTALTHVQTAFYHRLFRTWSCSADELPPFD